MNTKHTQGPWEQCRAFGQQGLIGPRNAFPVASVTGYYTRNGQSEANARLIAAAPMLLEALKPIAALRKHFTSKHGNRPTSGTIAAWHTSEGSDELTVEHLIAAVEAIAAATGETK